jgi:tRNA threonylcarbamoyladenosine biosynthesis protein TsaB
MLILSIDTSTRACSVALHQDSVLLTSSELFAEKSHSGMLTTLIDNTLKVASVSYQDLDAIAVAKGPGSYTGLRIGVSTAKGLCFALDKPLLGINTLEAMAWQVNDFVADSHLLCPMIDARRMEVYCSILDKKGQIIEPTQAKIIDEFSFLETLEKQSVVFFGDGAAKCQKAITHPNAIFLQNVIQPSAKTVGLLASTALNLGQTESVADFEPFYLKDFRIGN